MESILFNAHSCSSNQRHLNMKVICLFVVICLTVVVYTDEDYYKRLGVSREASTREIRQAFKKLALKMHPDKNPSDEEAHDRFLKINRAYEVLKDEDLRKKYDKYGEKGLEDNHEGGRYESWNFYRYDFGIYDDDHEIITLDRGDFDVAVNSGELWFVNFYFPRCSHCHDLAPTWREFAKEMDGVIRIGAVNCGDNRMLCRSNGINSYPSLYIYKAGMNPEKFFGDRTKKSLQDFAMQFVKSKVTELWAGNFVETVEKAFSSRIGWLVTFCAESGDCLGSESRHKLAGMLEGLVNVGWMDCSTQAQLCDSFDVTSSTTAYFPPGTTLKDKGGVLFLNTLDTKEIYTEVMKRLPDLEELTRETFKEKLAHHRWLLRFTFGEKESGTHEYKKLNTLLKKDNIQVGRIDCQSESDLCNSLYIHHPSIAVFKGTGINHFEIHHGKNILYNIVAFAKDSASAHVVTLGPETFPNKEKEPWLVDFFAPWCPPCRALLPELRKASKHLFGQLKFGTLDCTVHTELCSVYNIQAYPTTVIFNQSSIHEYDGHHSADGILEFIEDLVNPSVVTFNPDTFDELVKNRKTGESWLMDFYAPWCGPCQALLPEWKRMARLLSGIINVGSVDCQKYPSLCQRESVHAYPEIRFYLPKSQNGDEYHSYNGWHRDANSLKAWALGTLPRTSVDLTPEDFNKKVLNGGDHWVIDFYAPWCGPCQNFAPEFELLARSVKGRVKAGKVDCQAYPQTCQGAGIKAYPTVKMYPHLGEKKKSAEGEYINSREATVIADHLNMRLKQISPPLQDQSKLKDEL
ncbi:dnaJ homolog subfamily C member 10-like [Acipenser ruthenus]|uniref:dnaJ homolog subfamily C member 10-like n=1 Tax=Acipenser ruthenus TaxID=7906 RepID=UPI002741FB5D|nr:dnaJ homolog subfamily C member 10-like [Acipenser ruthenus]XP_033899339.3 dnaJ homolog subfamily C member 10-like [Acipenser ruthenus]XP_058889630.1 dnaJ homolog subfamily C member 10-like [Acipenser ruthenus]